MSVLAQDVDKAWGGMLNTKKVREQTASAHLMALCTLLDAPCPTLPQ